MASRRFGQLSARGFLLHQESERLRRGAPRTKPRTCLHIDLWTRSALYFQVLGKQTYLLWVGRTLPPPNEIEIA